MALSESSIKRNRRINKRKLAQKRRIIQDMLGNRSQQMLTSPYILPKSLSEWDPEEGFGRGLSALTENDEEERSLFNPEKGFRQGLKAFGIPEGGFGRGKGYSKTRAKGSKAKKKTKKKQNGNNVIASLYKGFK
jgi:hypothetical protein